MTIEKFSESEIADARKIIEKSIKDLKKQLLRSIPINLFFSILAAGMTVFVIVWVIISWWIIGTHEFDSFGTNFVPVVLGFWIGVTIICVLIPDRKNPLIYFGKTSFGDYLQQIGEHIQSLGEQEEGMELSNYHYRGDATFYAIKSVLLMVTAFHRHFISSIYKLNFLKKLKKKEMYCAVRIWLETQNSKDLEDFAYECQNYGLKTFKTSLRLLDILEWSFFYISFKKNAIIINSRRVTNEGKPF